MLNLLRVCITLVGRKGKWKGGAGGSKEEWVILELESMASINYLDIGNNGSAFIEVKVRN